MQVHLAGTPLMNVALDRGSQEASRRILPAALAVSLVILAVVLRRVAGVVAVMGAVAVTTLWTIGLMVLAGRTFNMVTVTLPSLLTVLSLSAGIHIVLRIQSLLSESGDAQSRRAPDHAGSVARGLSLERHHGDRIRLPDGLGHAARRRLRSVRRRRHDAVVLLQCDHGAGPALLAAGGQHRSPPQTDALDRAAGAGRRTPRSWFLALGGRHPGVCLCCS